ncbi:acyl-CoA dehydrogenase family protein [Streptomyces sp. Je 1-79]|uniref:acyl-CoA dehydrogenase family protein n=1 Tax=Streptomyces sp. Je 1-79 TaxID=2943847 RepID=UPI0021A30A93|nr:acyl-CoA dehydrogenase family protein [Streptomyces sp. Je 1-79]MCT4354034.1 acyl-CoA dehydrogenase family protein [Streptomyces sp. Je 1-79]
MRTPKKSALRPTSRPADRRGDDEIWPRVTRELADDLAFDAPARDRAGKPPFDEVARLQEAGLPALLTPPGASGHGADWRAACAVIREISAADGSIGELLAHHHVLAWTARFLTGGEPPASRTSPHGSFEADTAREGRLLAGGVEPSRTGAEPGLTLTPAPGGHVLDGRRSFASGVSVADRLVVGARCTETGELLVVVVDPADPAVFTEAGAERVGQRLAGAGTVTFDQLPVDPRNVLGSLPRDEHDVAPFTTLAPLALRLLLVHVGLGIAEGALAEARDVSRATRAVPPRTGSRTGAPDEPFGGEDPYLLLSYGELATSAHAAAAVVERATDALARGLGAGRSLGVEERADIAVLVAAAEAVTSRAAVRITTRILELVDTTEPAEAPGGGPGFDRFWRNARALTARSSPAHRLRDIGDHYLHGTRPGLRLLA